MREFLKGLELDKETIDTIMVEHGKYLTGLKEQVEDLKKENDDFQNEIKTLNETVETNNKSLENLQNVTNENKTLRAEMELKDNNVKKEFLKFVTSEVSSQVNDDVDFTSALKKYKEDNPQYFGETVVKKVQTSQSLNGGVPKEQTTNDIMNDIIRGAKNDN